MVNNLNTPRFFIADAAGLEAELDWALRSVAEMKPAPFWTRDAILSLRRLWQKQGKEEP